MQILMKIYKNESNSPAKTRDGDYITIRANIEGIKTIAKNINLGE